jgi:hypothetical protein
VTDVVSAVPEARERAFEIIGEVPEPAAVQLLGGQSGGLGEALDIGEKPSHRARRHLLVASHDQLPDRKDFDALIVRQPALDSQRTSTFSRSERRHSDCFDRVDHSTARDGSGRAHRARRSARGVA